MNALSARIIETNGGKPPIVLDMFSGRGIIPLEAARAGAAASGIDLSPVATLAGRLLADYPTRDWTNEPALPKKQLSGLDRGQTQDRLVTDVEFVLAEVDARVAERVAAFYPRNRRGSFPWGYLWVTTLPCDDCKRRFPLLGDLRLRLGMNKGDNLDQCLEVLINGDAWGAVVVNGLPSQQPTYSAGLRADGTKRKGKTARCIFCSHIHSLESVKAKCQIGEPRDVMVAVGEEDDNGRRVFRVPTNEEVASAIAASGSIEFGWPYSAIPNERIPSGNVHTIMGSGYGCSTFGDLMLPRQARLFAETVNAIRDVHRALLSDVGLSTEYSGVLASYAASNLCRRLRRSTRGASLALLRGGVSDIFTNETKINFGFDSFETGPGEGAGTWSSVAKSTVRALRKVVAERRGMPRA
jgi:adenine-specific DNA methylase